MLKGFKEFILRGNVIELAVAVVIGAAFTAIVTSIVESLINPAIGALFNAESLAQSLVVVIPTTTGGEAKIIFVSVPWSERVPPLILRLVTRWRRLRSAALLSAGTAGSATHTNNSGRWRWMRRQSLACTAVGSSRYGWRSASSRCS